MLLEALTSIQAQRSFTLGRDLEVVVADDGSFRSDSVQAIARAQAIHGVKVLRTRGRTGPAAARNFAVQGTCGEWLSFLDADDLYAPDALELRWATTQAHPSVGCVVTDYGEFAADAPFAPKELRGVIASTPRRRPAVQAAIDSGQTLVLNRPLKSFVGTMPMCTISVFVRRDAFIGLGGFPEGYDIGEDLHLWLRIAATQTLAYVPRVTAYCRKGHASLTRSESRLNLKTARCYEHLARDPLMAPVRRQLQALIAEGYLAEGYAARSRRETQFAREMAWAAVRRRPWHPAGWLALALAGRAPTTTV